jgi:hypothetical protein
MIIFVKLTALKPVPADFVCRLPQQCQDTFGLEIDHFVSHGVSFYTYRGNRQAGSERLR